MLALLACGSAEERLLLLVTSDTLRADRLGAYGSKLDLTPNLDALLADSQTFRFAYAPSAYTLPSMAALMTGRYPEEVGVRGNVSRMRRDFSTIAGVLRLHGWRTGGVVSNFVLRRGAGFEAGFERYDDHMREREASRPMPERTASGTTRSALAMLDELRQGDEVDRRVFLWVHYQDPHGPYMPPDGLRERYLPRELEEPDGRRELPLGEGPLGLGSIPSYQYIPGEHQAAFYRAGYDGEVAHLDAEIGRLLEGLDERGLLADAIVVFTADHGEGMGEQDYWFAHGEHLRDELVRVPLAIRVPDRAPALRSDPASLVDLFPTVLSLVGVAEAKGYPGRDLLREGAEGQDPEIYLAAVHHTTTPRFALVTRGFKYVATERLAGSHESLFRLGDEQRDLASQDDELLAEMRLRLAALRAALRTPEREELQQLTDADREQLRALGYVVD